uniref:Uncharacterized protein n=1 Tax=Vespula pensylvanica TaxID=30213 RepID=A0A834UGD8_VESPE|nr:hypothetical protein H0235_001012 [Vespula pensylvanica]
MSKKQMVNFMPTPTSAIQPSPPTLYSTLSKMNPGKSHARRQEYSRELYRVTANIFVNGNRLRLLRPLWPNVMPPDDSNVTTMLVGRYLQKQATEQESEGIIFLKAISSKVWDYMASLFGAPLTVFLIAFDRKIEEGEKRENKRRREQLPSFYAVTSKEVASCTSRTPRRYPLELPFIVPMLRVDSNLASSVRVNPSTPSGLQGFR